MAKQPDGDLLGDTELRRIYQRLTGPVAYVDESYRLPGPRGPGFYTLTGVMFSGDLVDHRRALLAAGRTTGGGPWHTTDAYENQRYEQIERFTATVAERSEWSIVTVEVPLASGALSEERRARAACLEQLLEEFTRGPDPARLFVVDHRTESGDRDDKLLAARLRGTKAIPHHTLLRHSGDHLEPLLAAPDAIGWTARRLLATGETRWVAPAAEALTILHASIGHRVDVVELVRKSNSAEQAAAISTPDHEKSAPKSGFNPPLLQDPVSHERTPRASTPTVLEELVVRVVARREALAVTGANRTEAQLEEQRQAAEQGRAAGDDAARVADRAVEREAGRE